MNLDIQPLKDHSDNRGFSFEIPGSLFAAQDAIRHAHMAAILPGHVRGNHFHLERHETLIVCWEDTWELGWIDPSGDTFCSRQFDGRGAISTVIPPRVPHALRNTGSRVLMLAAFSDTEYSVDAPDTIRRIVFPYDLG